MHYRQWLLQKVNQTGGTNYPVKNAGWSLEIARKMGCARRQTRRQIVFRRLVHLAISRVEKPHPGSRRHAIANANTQTYMKLLEVIARVPVVSAPMIRFWRNKTAQACDNACGVKK
jgi:hypothetical protein